MTVKKYIKERGWQIVCDTSMSHFMDVDIGFVNNEGNDDETEFTIHSFCVEELSELFQEFCKENGFKKNMVNYITVVMFHKN